MNLSLPASEPWCIRSSMGYTSELPLSASLVPCGYHKEFWPSWWLKTAESYYHMVLEARSPKLTSVHQNQRVGGTTLPPETLGGNLLLALPVSGGCQHSLFYGCITISSASGFTWLSVSVHLFLCLCVCIKSLCFSLIGALTIPLGSTWIVQDNLANSRSFIKSYLPRPPPHPTPFSFTR